MLVTDLCWVPRLSTAFFEFHMDTAGVEGAGVLACIFWSGRLNYIPASTGDFTRMVIGFILTCGEMCGYVDVS